MTVLRFPCSVLQLAASGIWNSNYTDTALSISPGANTPWGNILYGQTPKRALEQILEHFDSSNNNTLMLFCPGSAEPR
ncbi:hypothetical protein DTO280E4_5717 [Paecilomyces variotii]|nr:hypothetical protein DTO280E4_5717 [Paecilomyces variotii]